MDLRGAPVEDADVAAAARALPNLRALNLSGCKKLSPAVVPLLLAPSAGAPGRVRFGRAAPSLQVLGLSRCFQLTAGALGDVLSATSRKPDPDPDPAPLAAATLSHLALSGWPATAPAPVLNPLTNPKTYPFPAAPPLRGLRALALTNCSRLGPASLAAVASGAPRLRMLLLGGCTLMPPRTPAAEADAGAHMPAFPVLAVRARELHLGAAGAAAAAAAERKACALAALGARRAGPAELRELTAAVRPCALPSFA